LRYRRQDLGSPELEMIVEDPGASKNPWMIKRRMEKTRPRVQKV